MIKVLLATVLLASCAFAQSVPPQPAKLTDVQPPQLTEVESLRIRVNQLEGQLVKLQNQVVQLDGQLTIEHIKAEHGWGDDVSITMGSQGQPMAYRKPISPAPATSTK